MHAEFCIKTDHRSLVYLEDQRLSTPMQQKTLTKLLGLQYKIVFKSGFENRAVDPLSRHPSFDNHNSSVTCLAMSIVQPSWLHEVIQGYSMDPQA